GRQRVHPAHVHEPEHDDGGKRYIDSRSAHGEPERDKALPPFSSKRRGSRPRVGRTGRALSAPPPCSGALTFRGPDSEPRRPQAGRGGALLIAVPSPTYAIPANSRSIARNRPSTQTLIAGQPMAMIPPTIKVSTPETTSQPRPSAGLDAMPAPIFRMPTATSDAASTSVSTA